MRLKTIKEKTVTPQFLKKISYSLFFLTILIIVKSLILDIYVVPSRSMETAIQANDIIIVNKAAYGINIPNSLNQIGVLNGLFNLHDINILPFSNVWFKSDPRRNEIVLFYSPEKAKNNLLVKRCIGLPGEVVYIKNDSVFINSVVQNDLGTYKFDYVKKTDFWGIKERTKSKDLRSKGGGQNYVRHFYISVTEQENLNKKGYRMIRFQHNTTFPPVFPSFKQGEWNYQNYGPIKIPKKNEQIILTESVYSIYKDVIKQFEGKEVTRSISGVYYMDGKAIKTYKFKNDYYFLLGDNRLNAIDSRYFGFIPRILIKGRVEFIK